MRARVWLTLGLASMDLCWAYPWSLLAGTWAESSRNVPLMSATSVFALVLLGALSTHALGRFVGRSRVARYGLAGLGLLAVLTAVWIDHGFSGSAGPAIGLGLYLWWRGVRIGSQTPTYTDVESAFRWGIGLLIAFVLVLALTSGSNPGRLTSIVDTTPTAPFVVGFFFVSLVTLALSRLESLRTRTSAVAVNTQWLGLLIIVAGAVVLVALLIAQLVSFNLLVVATRPVFDLLGKVLLLVIYAIVIPLAYVLELLIYFVLSLLPANVGHSPPRQLGTADVDDMLQRLLAQYLPPELLLVFKVVGAGLLLVAALVIVARATSRWRPTGADAQATDEERDSVWDAASVKERLLAWVRRVLRRFAWRASAVEAAANQEAHELQPTQLSTVRELYAQLLRLGESVGARRAAATTPFEHLPALNQHLEPAQGAVDLTDAYVKVRYAESEASPDETAALREQLRGLRPRGAVE